MQIIKTIIENAHNQVSDECNLSFYSIDSNNRVKLDDALFIEFLEQNGFGIVREGDDIQLVRINDYIVSRIIHTDVKQFVLEYVAKNAPQEVKNYFYRAKDLFTMKYLDGLSSIELDVLRDTKDAAYFYFKNGVVKVTKDGIEAPVPYSSFKKLVWEESIQDREFKLVDIESNPPEFLTFINHICGGEPERVGSLCTVLGYLLHNYRTTANTKAVIFNDELVSDQPEGGSGKSLLASALKFFRNVYKRDGKRFNPSHEFAWSNIDESVDIVVIDETSANFSFSELFSVITEGFEVNAKYKNAFHLPVEKSPLILITTNKVIRGSGSSHRRRQVNVDICQYYNSDYTPQDEFGHSFFYEWDNQEWHRFDVLMLMCVNNYLINGLVEVKASDSKRKDAIKATCESFVFWMEEVIDSLVGKFTGTTEARQQYLFESNLHNVSLTAKKFLQWVEDFCKIYGYQLKAKRNAVQRGFIIYAGDEKEN